MIERLKKIDIDPRNFQIVSLATYSIAAREIFHFERSHWIMILCVLLAVVTDYAVGRLYFRTKRFPLSAITIGLACSILIDSKIGWTYALTVIGAILSKAFIRVDGRHIYNPGNFGVVLVLQLVPWLAVGSPALFSGAFAWSVFFFFLGAFVAWYAGQLLTSIAWIVFFVLFAGARSALLGSNIVYLLLPILSPTFLLFTFHMITCPATTPQSSNRARILYAFIIALTDGVFRLLEIPYGNFYALFIASSLLPVVRVGLLRDPWKRVAVQIG